MSAGLATAPTPDQEAADELDLVRERVLLRVRRRLAWRSHLDAECGSDPLARITLDTPTAEARFYAAQTALHPLADRLAAVETSLDRDLTTSHLQRLVRLFDLDLGERDILAAALALELAPALGPAYAHLAGAPFVTEPLVARLFGHPPAPLAAPGCSLRQWHLLLPVDAAPGEPAPLHLDPVVRAWLTGQLTIPPALVGVVRRIDGRDPLRAWPLDTVVAALVDHLRTTGPVRLVVAGSAASGRRTFAAAALRALGLDAFAVATARIPESDWSDRALLVVRHALLAGAAPIWELPAEARTWPEPIAALAAWAVVCAPHDRPAPVDGVLDIRVDLPAPDLDERTDLWRALVPAARHWPTADIATLVRRYPLPVGELATIGLQRPATAEAAAELCRAATRHRLGELGQVLRCPFRMADLVVPPKLRDHLAELTFEARDRVDFWERPEARRLYPRGTGLVALFTGSAGTGKTMAAQVLAAELGLDLVRIDLASLVSKYIGETAKNLRRIFTAAAGMTAVLLFDEADALFARRTDVRDAHDRHANADTNYLLQLVEDFSGVAVLASNKKANIDPAFTRRIRHILDFTRPDAAARQQIWHSVLHELAAELPHAAVAALSVLDLTGAQIKNTVLAAVFIARSERRELAVSHLVRGLERELQKDGRVLDRNERERLAMHG